MADTFIFNNCLAWAHYRLKGGRRILVLPTVGYSALIGGLIIASLRVDPKETQRILNGWMVALLVLQCGTLLLYGGSTVRAAVRKDLTTGMINSHRLMPISGTEAIVGYILGAVPQPVAVFASNLLIGILVGGPAGLNPLDWVVANAILLLFAVCGWVVIACISFLSPKSAGALIFLVVLLGIPGGVVLVAVPAISVVCTPLIGATVYGVMTSGPGSISVYQVPILCQICVTILFFIAAARKFRRDDVLAAGPWFGLLIVGVFVAISAYGIMRWAAVGPFPLASAGGMQQMQLLSSITVATLIGFIPISAAAWLGERYRRRRRLNDPALGHRPIGVALIVPVVAAMITLLVVLCAPSSVLHRQPIVLTFVCLTACLLPVGLLMSLRYRTKSSAAVLTVLWIALTWVSPWLVAFGMMALSDVDTASRVASAWERTSAIAGFSPIGTLVALWTDAQIRYVPGLIGQAVLAAGLAIFYYTRPAPRELFVPVVGASS